MFILLCAFILVAFGLAWFFVSHDHGEKEPIGALWIAAGFGLGGAVIAAILESIFIPSNFLASEKALLPLFGATLAIGLIEECCKFIPLALFIYHKRYFNEHTDGIIYFVLAGLGFGLPENILYTLQYGTSAGLGRMILTPFFHATTTAMVGYFLVRVKIDHRPKREFIFALLGAIILHAVYDFGLSSGNQIYAVISILITLGLSIGLFVFYMRATDLDQDEGLSAVGHNQFCRSCGSPNPHHHLYCTHCGNYA